MLLPLIPLKKPPVSRWPLAARMLSTWPLALDLKAATTAPVVVLISAMFLTAVLPTMVNFPPM